MSDLIDRQQATETHACDLIYRQQAIDVIDKIFPADPMRNDYTQGITCGAALATEYIEQLPPAQPEQRWIPCSERLPEEGQNCLVCDKGSIGIDAYIGHGNPYNWKWYMRDYEAWIPLPEPYMKGDTK